MALICSVNSLSDLGLTSIPAELLQKLPNLENLDLSKNKLTAIEFDGTLPQIKTLSFSSNQLSNVDGLSAFPNLENLNVTNNPTLEVTQMAGCVVIFNTRLKIISWNCLDDGNKIVGLGRGGSFTCRTVIQL